jgi:carbon-monoxide dehydrogenase small subunit
MSSSRAAKRAIRLRVNGVDAEGIAEPRKLLSDFIREDLGLTGTHVGCEHGVCGACTVLLDGEPVRTCLMFAVQADGQEILTVEGLAPGPDQLHPIQEAFWACHGLQCGFCTPGFMLTIKHFLAECPNPSERQVREAISGNLCRCTGYQNIVKSALYAAALLRGARPPDPGTEAG